MTTKIAALATAAFLAGTVQAFALGTLFPSKDRPGGPPISHSAPGPVIGVGLPLAALIGGYLWYRSRARR